MAVAVHRIASYVLMDLETTGLYSIGETPRIVEMSFIAVSRKHIDGLNNTKDCSPRVLDKLVLCVNPGGKPMTCGSSFVTGLYNDILEDLPVFDENAVNMLSLFLSRLPQPVCLLAHNGNKFDFPMLKMELERLALSLPGDILCADTLEALRVIDPSRETTSKQDLNEAVAGCRLFSTPGLSNQRAGSLPNSRQPADRCTGPEYFSSEITPVKLDDSTASFENPPPAPRKKRNRPENGRHVGNMRSAKRRLLQDESGGCDLNSGVFSLDTCAASPPLSPQAPPRSLARRRLAFTEASGKATDSNSGTSVHVEKGDNCNELLPFPDDFSDSNSEGSIEDQTIGDGSHNSNDHSSSSQGLAHFTAVSNNHTDSFPDEDLISAVDQLLDQTSRNQSSGAGNYHVVASECTNSPETQTQGHTATDSLITQNQDGQETVNSSATQNQNGQETASSSATQNQEGRETTNSSATQNQEGRETANSSSTQSQNGQEIANSSATQNQDGQEDTNSSVTQNHVQNVTCKSSESNSAKSVIFSEASDIYSAQGTPRKRDQSELRTAAAMTKDVKNYTNQMTAMHSDNHPEPSSGNLASATFPSSSTMNSRKSFKLIEIYKRVFSRLPKVSHAAEDDCITLLKIIQACANEFGKWADENALPFSDVKKMY